MEKPGTSIKRDVKVTPYVFKKIIPFLKGRPDRIVAICDDDLVNLKIALNIDQDLDGFLKMV